MGVYGEAVILVFGAYIFYLLLMRSRKKKGGKRLEEAGKKKEEVRWKEKKMGILIPGGSMGQVVKSFIQGGAWGRW